MAGSADASLAAIRLPLTMPPLENDHRRLLHPYKFLSYMRYWSGGLNRPGIACLLPIHLMRKLPESSPRLFDNYQKTHDIRLRCRTLPLGLGKRFRLPA
jgi:hypothetical protein